MVACRASLQVLHGVFVERGMARSEWRHAALVGQHSATFKSLLESVILYIFINQR